MNSSDVGVGEVLHREAVERPRVQVVAVPHLPLEAPEAVPLLSRIRAEERVPQNAARQPADNNTETLFFVMQCSQTYLPRPCIDLQGGMDSDSVESIPP